MTKTVIFAVGGSGGHVLPAQIVAKEMQAADASLRVQFLGTRLSECKFFDATKFDHVDIPSAPLGFKRPFKALTGLFQIVKGTWLAYNFLKHRNPGLVVGFGSYHSFPVILAAALRKTPFMLFEPNVFAGRVNRWFASRSKAVLVPYTECRKYLSDPVVQVKIPFRQGFDEAFADKQKAAEYFGLKTGVFTVLVMGGSQGARFLNTLCKETFEILADRGIHFQVIHLCGKPAEQRPIQEVYHRCRIPAVCKPFESSMHMAFILADIAVCRIGAMTMAELIEFNLPAIVIPFPGAKDNHQDYNANFFVEHIAGGIKIKEEMATTEKMLSVMMDLMGRDGKRLEEFRAHLKEFKSTLSTKMMAAYLLESL